MSLNRRFNGCSAAICAFTLLVGCGNDDDGTASGSNSNSQSGTGDSEPTDSATEPTGGASNSGSSTGAEGGMSDSLSGTTSDEGGMSDSLSGTVSSGVESDSMSGTSNTTTMGEGGGESTGSSGDETTGAPLECTSIDNEADCVAAECMPIIGRKFFIDAANACLELPSFLACAEQAACPDVITTVCKGDPNKNKYQLPNGCAPPDFEPCTPPPDAGMDGYAECP